MLDACEERREEGREGRESTHRPCVSDFVVGCSRVQTVNWRSVRGERTRTVG